MKQRSTCTHAKTAKPREQQKACKNKQHAQSHYASKNNQRAQKPPPGSRE
ncbi:hypothetical protein [Rufibacter sp. XAAS-G3-1]|nr:hypothetical protein [Rufibacter sp. XAAS-G3-1]